jgi:hypothetical protein
MASIDKSNKLGDFPKFLPLEQSVVKDMIKNIIQRLLQNMITVLGIEDQPEISIDYDTMSEIISRVEKRRVYFHIRHATISNTTLNAKIAYTFFLNVLFYVAAKTSKKVNVRKPVLDQILYAFKFRDLSKEAIMALAEGLLY